MVLGHISASYETQPDIADSTQKARKRDDEGYEAGRQGLKRALRGDSIRSWFRVLGFVCQISREQVQRLR